MALDRPCQDGEIAMTTQGPKISFYLKSACVRRRRMVTLEEVRRLIGEYRVYGFLQLRAYSEMKTGLTPFFKRRQTTQNLAIL